MSEQFKMVRNGDLDAAAGAPAVMGGVMAMLKAARAWAKRQRQGKRYDWWAGTGAKLVSREEKAALRRQHGRVVNFRKAQEHPQVLGVKPFRVTHGNHGKQENDGIWQTL